MVVHPLLNRLGRISQALTGIDPRHRPHHLSLLPSGPDEVRGRLLRGGRSTRHTSFGHDPREGVQPRMKRISGGGHR